MDSVFRFVLFVAILPPLLSAGSGVLSLQAAGILPTEQAENTTLTWFTGNVAGILTFAPLFLIGSPRLARIKLSGHLLAEVLLLGICFLGVGR